MSRTAREALPATIETVKAVEPVLAVLL